MYFLVSKKCGGGKVVKDLEGRARAGVPKLAENPPEIPEFRPRGAPPGGPRERKFPPRAEFPPRPPGKFPPQKYPPQIPTHLPSIILKPQ